LLLIRLFRYFETFKQTPMEKVTQFGPKYGPITKEGAKYMYDFYSAESVIGSIDWPIAKKMMDFYKMYL